MKVKSISATNYRSFVDTGKIELSDINILIGANNSGKSSILRALHQIQNGLDNIYGDVRVGFTQSVIEIELDSVSNFGGHSSSSSALYTCQLTSGDRRTGNYHSTLALNNQQIIAQGEIKLVNIAPHHFITPYLSKRKSSYFREDVKEETVNQVTPDTSTLAAKLTKIANPSFPAYEEYTNACKEILGFVVTATPSLNGQRPGVYLQDESIIPLEQMGEGVPNIVLLLAYLANAKDKLFLIEEPENDLHPQALKALLDLIIASSERNQFVISTHSNIVVSYLGSSAKSKIFRVTTNKDELPHTATINEIPHTAESRIQVLQELGYAFSDYDMWDGWLLLEEASAERIIRDYLIPWYAPKLSRIKTVSAAGVDNIEPAFKDLHRLMLFTHLQPAYAGRAWVRVDGDEAGQGIIAKLRDKFKSVKLENFSTFDQPKFEDYYPNEFKDKVDQVFSIKDRQERQKAKTELIVKVADWLDDDLERGKNALSVSAKSVINDLKRIETEFENLKKLSLHTR